MIIVLLCADLFSLQVSVFELGGNVYITILYSVWRGQWSQLVLLVADIEIDEGRCPNSADFPGLGNLEVTYGAVHSLKKASLSERSPLLEGC